MRDVPLLLACSFILAVGFTLMILAVWCAVTGAPTFSLPPWGPCVVVFVVLWLAFFWMFRVLQ